MALSARPRRRGQAGRPDPYAQIGVPPQASAEDVERAHAELVIFLQGAPPSVRGWAREELAAVDDAYAMLRAPTRAGKRRHRDRRPLRRLSIWALALVAVAGVVVGVYETGATHTKTASGDTATEGHGLNAAQKARVTELMQTLSADPHDARTLIALGDIFFEAHEYSNASTFMKQALAAEPHNLTARTALGAAEFNAGDAVDAQQAWRQVVAADPKAAEAYYDLGFLYLSREPPDTKEAKNMWEHVLKLEPHSSVAKTIETHLKGMESR